MNTPGIGPETATEGAAGSDEWFFRRHKKTTFFLVFAAVLAALLVYLQLNLPFFRKFLPVADNKLLIVILNINLLVILYLIFYVIRTLFKTYIEKKRGIWGSGLKTKLTITVFSISIVSTSALFILTTWFFYSSMDKWFSDKVEEAIENARELSLFYYEDLFGRYEKMGKSLAGAIEDKHLLDDHAHLAPFIKTQGRTNFLGLLSVVDKEGQSKATFSRLDFRAGRALNEKLSGLVAGKKPASILSLKDGELLLFVTPLRNDAHETIAYLILGQKIRVQGAKTMKQIGETYQQFKEARPLKKVLKYSFTIPLFLVTMLSIVFSIWIGRKMATEITIPLERVKEGAAIIAAGRFDINLEDRGKDEIGTLVGAFNRMAKELKIAKGEIEEKRRYMEVILDNVATGIISTDTRGNVLLFNRAAREILKVETDAWIGVPLRHIVGDDFKKIIRPFLKEIKQDEAENVEQEMVLSLQNDTLYLRTSLTVLRDEAKKIEGYIATFDDITHIVKAEKLATWREIAKRMAHEIKNPLTPIRLSAERLRRRVLPRLEGVEKEVLDEATAVILSSSEDITVMVNELRKLTHSSTEKKVEDINEIVEETVGIYRNLMANITFVVEAGVVPRFSMDREDIKRALVNLFTNSIRAIGEEQGTITVSTWHDEKKSTLWVEVADTGPGIKDAHKSKVLDPYFTTAPDGTGLGLAIVHSVVLEHNGKLYIEDNIPKGARIVMELPVLNAVV